MKPSQIIEILIRCLPYPGQIKDIEMEADAIRFKWRSNRFRVSGSLMVETVGDGVLSSDTPAMLLQALMKQENMKQQ